MKKVLLSSSLVICLLFVILNAMGVEYSGHVGFMGLVTFLVGAVYPKY